MRTGAFESAANNYPDVATAISEAGMSTGASGDIGKFLCAHDSVTTDYNRHYDIYWKHAGRPSMGDYLS